MRGRLHRPPEWLAATALLLVVFLAATAAFAGVGATDGGGTVSVSVSTSTSIPGTNGAGQGHPSSGGSGPICTWTGVSSTDPYGGVTVSGSGVGGSGTWYLLVCQGASAGVAGSGLVWVPGSAPSAPTRALTPPSAVAAQAEGEISLPSPTIDLSPSGFSVVGLPTWMWVDPSIWRTYSASASAGGLTATATATPVSVSWDMGDGTPSVTCSGPGSAYQVGVPSDEQQTSCLHTYRTSSVGQPSPDGNPNDGAFVVTATITWEVSWSSSVHAAGSLAPLQTRSSTSARVEQVQSVDSLT